MHKLCVLFLRIYVLVIPRLDRGIQENIMSKMKMPWVDSLDPAVKPRDDGYEKPRDDEIATMESNDYVCTD